MECVTFYIPPFQRKRPVCVVTTYTGLQVKVKVKKLRELFYILGLAFISFWGIAYK